MQVGWRVTLSACQNGRMMVKNLMVMRHLGNYEFLSSLCFVARGGESSVLALQKRLSTVGGSGDSIAPSAEVRVRSVGELLSEIRCVVLFKAEERKSRSTRP